MKLKIDVLCQELLHSYHEGDKGKLVGIKNDLIKAYDMVKWQAILDILKAIDTLQYWVDMISHCITTLRFSINFNFEQIDYLQAPMGFGQLIHFLHITALFIKILNRIIGGKIATLHLSSIGIANSKELSTYASQIVCFYLLKDMSTLFLALLMHLMNL